MTTARQQADTARRVADTYPELLTPDEFNPTFPRGTAFPRNTGALPQLPVPPTRRVDVRFLLQLPAALRRSSFTALQSAVALPVRVVGLVTLAEQTLTAGYAVVTRTCELLDRIEAATGTAENVTRAAAEVATAAAATVEHAGTLTARAAALLEDYSEPLGRLQPMLRRLAETTQPEALDALVALLDRLPQLAEAMNHELIPLLGHLDRVGPDVNQLLDSVAQLNHMTSRFPAVFRRHHHPGP
jgi:hypothetical protein